MTPDTSDHPERIRYLRARTVPWKEIARVLGRPDGSLRVLACVGRRKGGAYAGIPIPSHRNPLELPDLPWRVALAIREAAPLPANRKTIWRRMYDGARRDEVRSNENIDQAVRRVRTALGAAGLTVRNQRGKGWYMDAVSAARFDELLDSSAGRDRLMCDQVTEGKK